MAFLDREAFSLLCDRLAPRIGADTTRADVKRMLGELGYRAHNQLVGDVLDRLGLRLRCSRNPLSAAQEHEVLAHLRASGDAVQSDVRAFTRERFGIQISSALATRLLRDSGVYRPRRHILTPEQIRTMRRFAYDHPERPPLTRDGLRRFIREQFGVQLTTAAVSSLMTRYACSRTAIHGSSAMIRALDTHVFEILNSPAPDQGWTVQRLREALAERAGVQVPWRVLGGFLERRGIWFDRARKTLTPRERAQLLKKARSLHWLVEDAQEHLDVTQGLVIGREELEALLPELGVR